MQEHDEEDMSFEQLKREAAALERQLEERLSRYQQVRSRVILSSPPLLRPSNGILDYWTDFSTSESVREH